MTIRLKRLPKLDDYNGRYEYEGSDARYEIERFGSSWRIKIEGHSGTQDFDDSLGFYNEVRAFVEAYDEHPGQVGERDRWEAASAAAQKVWDAKMDARDDERRRMMDELGF